MSSGTAATDSPGAEAHPEIVRRHGGLLGRTFLVSSLTLASRLLGFVREVLTAFLFGDSSAVSDAFFTAWRVPNLFRRLFGEGALSTSLQTALTETDHDQGPDAGRILFLRTLRLLLWILVPVTGLAMLGAALIPDRMPGTDWAWLGANPEPVRDLTMRLLPFLLFVCLAAIAAGALQVRGHFLTPYLAPVGMNVAWIAALVVLGFAFGWQQDVGAGQDLSRQWRMAQWLAWGVLAGGVLQVFVQVPALRSRGLLGRVAEPAPEAPRAWSVLRQSLPLALGAAVYQINVMVDGLMAESLLLDGGPSALYYANRIQQFPLALVAIAATNAVFPSLKALGHLGRKAEMRELHDRSQLGVAFLAVPAGAGLFVLAAPIAHCLFEHGNYGPEGAQRIAATLRMLAFALLPAGAVGLVGRSYYALGDFGTPVRVSIAMLIANAFLNVGLVVGLDMDADGLALATAITSWGNLALLLPGLHRRLGGSRITGLGRRVAGILLASAVSCALAWAAYRGLGAVVVETPEDLVRSPLALFAGGLVGAAAYLAVAAALRLPEWRHLAGRRRGRER